MATNNIRQGVTELLEASGVPGAEARLRARCIVCNIGKILHWLTGLCKKDQPPPVDPPDSPGPVDPVDPGSPVVGYVPGARIRC